MNHLKTKSPSGVIGDFETLVTTLSRYNGGGQGNCTRYPQSSVLPYSLQYRPTRWREIDGKCERHFEGEDDIYPMNWISERHQNMDLINCQILVDFQCEREASPAVDGPIIRNRFIEYYGVTPEERNLPNYVEDALRLCFKGGSVCNAADTEDNKRRFPLFKRPGVITTAIMMHHYSMNECDGGGGGGGGGDVPADCTGLPGSTANLPSSCQGSVAQTALEIVKDLERGYWCNFNKPSESMPDKYAYSQFINNMSPGNLGKFLFNYSHYEREGWHPEPYGPIRSDTEALFWCTWLPRKAYDGAGYPHSTLQALSISARNACSNFKQGTGGFEYIYNEPGAAQKVSPGDVICYYSPSANAVTHVGIVCSVSNDYVVTVESNTWSTSLSLTVENGYVHSPSQYMTVEGFGTIK
jgi:hypothetical protein